ncbi:hypothetical protein [Rouxiella sp. Mn2063]|uniref:hypothetical protein n=1 Tax=Rouxiella sp. Mn2063 TaxID=3395262 RepID=UPI003BD66342
MKFAPVTEYSEIWPPLGWLSKWERAQDCKGWRQPPFTRFRLQGRIERYTLETEKFTDTCLGKPFRLEEPKITPFPVLKNRSKAEGFKNPAHN